MTSPDDTISFFGRLKEKLIETKQNWARDGRLSTNSACPPASGW
jgi:hypothetical protein